MSVALCGTRRSQASGVGGVGGGGGGGGGCTHTRVFNQPRSSGCGRQAERRAGGKVGGSGARRPSPLAARFGSRTVVMRSLSCGRCRRPQIYACHLFSRHRHARGGRPTLARRRGLACQPADREARRKWCLSIGARLSPTPKMSLSKDGSHPHPRRQTHSSPGERAARPPPLPPHTRRHADTT